MTCSSLTFSISSLQLNSLRISIPPISATQLSWAAICCVNTSSFRNTIFTHQSTARKVWGDLPPAKATSTCTPFLIPHHVHDQYRRYLVYEWWRVQPGGTNNWVCRVSHRTHVFCFVLFIYGALLQVRVVQHRLLLEFLVRCNPLRLSGEYHHSTSSIHNDSFGRSQFY